MKKLRIALGIIQSFVALMAIPAGLSMLFEPDGSGIGISTDMLSGTPFLDFFFPALFLFTVNGLCQLIGAIFSFRKSKWTGILGIALGISLILWIIVQVYFTNGIVNFLQPLFFVVGVVEIVLGGIIYSKNKKQTK